MGEKSDSEDKINESDLGLNHDHVENPVGSNANIRDITTGPLININKTIDHNANTSKLRNSAENGEPDSDEEEIDNLLSNMQKVQVDVNKQS